LSASSSQLSAGGGSGTLGLASEEVEGASVVGVDSETK